MQWEKCRGKVSKERVAFLEKRINISFPKSYIECMEECNGGVLRKRCFTYKFENERQTVDSIGVFLSLNQNEWADLLDIYENPPEFFPKGIIAFGDTGGGDFICFDYRDNKTTNDPPIVCWNHEADVGKDVSFLANNFEDFLGMLKEPEELPSF